VTRLSDDSGFNKFLYLITGENTETPQELEYLDDLSYIPA